MADKIKIDSLAEVLNEGLRQYSFDIRNKIAKAVDEVAEDFLTDTRADAPVMTGDYKASILIKKADDLFFKPKRIWYVEAPEYRLTHLLEYGHRSHNGSVKAYPHIKKNEEKAQKEFVKRVEAAIKNAK